MSSKLYIYRKKLFEPTFHLNQKDFLCDPKIINQQNRHNTNQVSVVTLYEFNIIYLSKEII